MALWAGVVAVLLALCGFLTRQFDVFLILRSVVEVSAVIGVFALICAAEASN